MLRPLLLLILIAFIARAFWRVVDGVIEGMRGRPVGAGTAATPSRGVQMVRDPVCGTFVLPERAITLVSGGRETHFCSTQCRDAFVARPESPERARA